VIVAGGMVRRTDGALVGDMTAQAIEGFKVDCAVIGTSALDTDGDLLDFDLQEVRVSRAIIRQSRRCFLATDASKLGRSAPVRVASLSDIDAVFIDQPLPTPLAALCATWDTRIVLPEVAGDGDR
jgi:DeoR family glycerol-3-phosphate regulon repressor